MNAHIEWIDHTPGPFWLGQDDPCAPIEFGKESSVVLGMQQFLNTWRAGEDSDRHLLPENGVFSREVCEALKDFYGDYQTTWLGDDELLDLCPDGVTLPDCTLPVETKAKKKTDWGLFLLGAAVLAAGVYSLS